MDEEGPYYRCCNHCAAETGEYCLDLDKHTVGCNEVDPRTNLLCIVGNVVSG